MTAEEVVVQPRFIPDEGSPPELTSQYETLAALVMRNPTESLAAINFRTHTELLAAADTLRPRDRSAGSTVMRTLAAIMRNGYDLAVDYDGPTTNAIRLIRELGPEEGARMRRLGAYTRRLAAWSLQQDNAAEPSFLSGQAA